MKNLFFLALVVISFGIAGIVYANLDDFDGNDLSDIWTYRDPLGKGEYSIEGGKLSLDLKAGADMYKRGVDGGVMFLMEPPDSDNFTLEMMINVAIDGNQAPSCHFGPILFNEVAWAYSAWGPYAGQDIRLEDCIDQDYRWRDQTQIAVDVGDVAIDENLWLKIVRTGNELEFFAKGDEDGEWLSGGVDEKLSPNYTAGDYQVGIFAKSWGGSIDTSITVDFFNIPQLAPVDPSGKLATTWSAIKK